MHKLIHFIADYAPGDLAVSEVVSALCANVPNDYVWQFTSVHSFDTISAGFAVAQLGLQREPLRPQETIVYANCAPRKDRREARKNNEGEGFVYGLLKNGVKVLAVNSGHSLSFVRDELEEFRAVNVDRGGSQFRSRDNFPQIIGRAARGDLSFLSDQLDPHATISEVPASCVAYVDSFGNLKTTIRDGSPEIAGLVPGSRVVITINNVEMAATVASGSFNVQEGDIAFAPGSSGHGTGKFWELFQRGGSAWHTFKKPRPGAHVALRPLREG
jgi:hypothetical protein